LNVELLLLLLAYINNELVWLKQLKPIGVILSAIDDVEQEEEDDDDDDDEDDGKNWLSVGNGNWKTDSPELLNGDVDEDEEVDDDFDDKPKVLELLLFNGFNRRKGELLLLLIVLSLITLESRAVIKRGLVVLLFCCLLRLAASNWAAVKTVAAKLFFGVSLESCWKWQRGPYGQ
jgi:hypothetical protein